MYPNSVRFVIPFVAVQERSRKGKNGWYAPSSKTQKIIGQYALAARAKAGIPFFAGDCQVSITLLGFDRKDVDNAIKLILDACNGVLWEDDDQVVLVIARKIRIGEPRMEVDVSAM